MDTFLTSHWLRAGVFCLDYLNSTQSISHIALLYNKKPLLQISFLTSHWLRAGVFGLDYLNSTQSISHIALLYNKKTLLQISSWLKVNPTNVLMPI